MYFKWEVWDVYENVLWLRQTAKVKMAFLSSSVCWRAFAQRGSIQRGEEVEEHALYQAGPEQFLNVLSVIKNSKEKQTKNNQTAKT